MNTDDFYEHLCDTTQSTWVVMGDGIYMDACTYPDYEHEVKEALSSYQVNVFTVGTYLAYPVIYVHVSYTGQREHER